MGGKGSGRTGASAHDSQGRWASDSSSGCLGVLLCIVLPLGIAALCALAVTA